MNKTILATVLITAIIAVSIIAVYTISPLVIKAQEPNQQVKEITINLTNRIVKHRENINTTSDGQWIVTIKSINGNVKAVNIIIVNLDNWKSHSTKWLRLDPSVGDSFTVNLPAGHYRLIILAAGRVNSTITITVSYP